MLEFFSQNPAYIIIGIVLFLILGGVILFILRPIRSAEPDLKVSRSASDETDTVPVEVPGHPVNYVAPVPTEGAAETAPVEAPPTEEPKTLHLKLLPESGKGIEIAFLPASIGSDSENDIVLEDASISARHARIQYDQRLQVLCIEDLDSQTGLLVNNQPTHKNILKDGDRIQIGQTIFVFEDTGFEPPADGLTSPTRGENR